MFIVSTAQMQLAEAAADARGQSYAQLMENAGSVLVEAMAEQFNLLGAQVTILIGPGNNGGDGLVAARYLLTKGAHVQVYVWKRNNLPHDDNWQALNQSQISLAHWAEDEGGKTLKSFIENSAFVLDALLGTGASRPIQGDLAELLKQVSRSHESMKSNSR